MIEHGVYLDDDFYASYNFINENDHLFYKTFYDEFLSSSQLIEIAFSHTNLARQYQMLRDSIKHMVDFYLTEEANDYLIRIAKIHAQDRNIDSYMFKLFLDSFITALSKVYPGYCEKCEIAWRKILSPGIEFMRSFKLT